MEKEGGMDGWRKREGGREKEVHQDRGRMQWVYLLLHRYVHFFLEENKMRHCPVCACDLSNHTHTNTYTDTRGLTNLKEALHTPSSACVAYEAAACGACATYEVAHE